MDHGFEGQSAERDRTVVSEASSTTKTRSTRSDSQIEYQRPEFKILLRESFVFFVSSWFIFLSCFLSWVREVSCKSKAPVLTIPDSLADQAESA
jgi:hypothetical protein